MCASVYMVVVVGDIMSVLVCQICNERPSLFLFDGKRVCKECAAEQLQKDKKERDNKKVER